jgi:hypothetical protein
MEYMYAAKMTATRGSATRLDGNNNMSFFCEATHSSMTAGARDRAAVASSQKI